MDSKFGAEDILKLFKKVNKRIEELWCLIEKTAAKVPVNIGTGYGLYKQLKNNKWEFKSILPGRNVTITEQNNTITINSSGGGDFDCNDVKDCLGISNEGDPNTFLNEQGDFVRIGAGGFTCTDLNSCSTTNLPEGTNLYYTQARFNSAFSAKSTTDLSEGTNLYFTNVRAVTALTGQNISIFTNNSGYITLSSLSAGTGINYNNLTGVITNTAPDQTVALTPGTGISVSGSYPNFTITNTAPSTNIDIISPFLLMGG